MPEITLYWGGSRESCGSGVIKTSSGKSGAVKNISEPTGFCCSTNNLLEDLGESSSICVVGVGRGIVDVSDQSPASGLRVEREDSWYEEGSGEVWGRRGEEMEIQGPVGEWWTGEG